MIGEEFTLRMVCDPALGTTEFYLPPEQLSHPIAGGVQIASWDPLTGVLEVMVATEGETTVAVRPGTPCWQNLAQASSLEGRLPRRQTPAKTDSRAGTGEGNILKGLP